MKKRWILGSFSLLFLCLAIGCSGGGDNRKVEDVAPANPEEVQKAYDDYDKQQSESSKSYK